MGGGRVFASADSREVDTVEQCVRHDWRQQIPPPNHQAAKGSASQGRKERPHAKFLARSCVKNRKKKRGCQPAPTTLNGAAKKDLFGKP